MCRAEPTGRIELIARTGPVAYLQPGTGTGCQIIGLKSQDGAGPVILSSNHNNKNNL